MIAWHAARGSDGGGGVARYTAVGCGLVRVWAAFGTRPRGPSRMWPPRAATCAASPWLTIWLLRLHRVAGSDSVGGGADGSRSRLHLGFLLLFELMNFQPTDTNAAMGGGVTCAAVLLVRLAPPPARAARAVSPWEAGGLLTLN